MSYDGLMVYMANNTNYEWKQLLLTIIEIFINTQNGHKKQVILSYLIDSKNVVTKVYSTFKYSQWLL